MARLPLTITVTQANLNPSPSTARIPPTPSRVGSDTNKVVQKIVADYFSGLNFGFIGSHGAQSEHAGTDDWKLALLDLVRQQAESEAAPRRCR